MISDVTIPPADLERSYARSRATIQQLPVRHDDVVVPLERLLGTYEAVMEATRHHDAAIYVSAHEARRAAGQPGHAQTQQTYAYPDRPGKLAHGIELTRKTLAAYCASIAKEARTRLYDAPATVTVGAKQYTLRETVVESVMPFMVGLEDEYATLRKSVRQIFLYNPQTRTNSEKGHVTETFLLCGPPGTGKSTLLKAVVAHAQYCSQLNGTSLHFASYDASGFSSYFGQSTKILKKLLKTTRSPEGAGIFVIEDADMVLQSRDDQHKSHGILELQQYLMNELSGLRPSLANTLTILTTNKTEHIDEAMRSRMQSVMVVNPFTKLHTHQSFWSARAPQMSSSDIAALAKQTHAAEFTGRDLDGIIRSAVSAATTEPTDEEIRMRGRIEPLVLPTRASFESSIAVRKAARHTRAS